MFSIAIALTCAIISASLSNGTNPALVVIEKNALMSCINQTDPGNKQRLTPVEKVIGESQNTQVSLVQSIANRLIKKIAIDWDNNDSFEIHTVLAFTFMTFRILKLEKEAATGDEQILAEKFFSHRTKEQIKKKLGNIAVGKKVLDIGCGVCVEKHIFGSASIRGCFVFYTSDDLLPKFVKGIANTAIFNAKTTLHAAEFALRESLKRKEVLYKWRCPMMGTSIVYQVLVENPLSIGREPGKVLSQVEWCQFTKPGKDEKASFGFGYWKTLNGNYLIIFRHFHKLVNVNPERPAPTATDEQQTPEKAIISAAIQPEQVAILNTSVALPPATPAPPPPTLDDEQEDGLNDHDYNIHENFLHYGLDLNPTEDPFSDPTLSLPSVVNGSAASQANLATEATGNKNLQNNAPVLEVVEIEAGQQLPNAEEETERGRRNKGIKTQAPISVEPEKTAVNVPSTKASQSNGK